MISIVANQIKTFTRTLSLWAVLTGGEAVASAKGFAIVMTVLAMTGFSSPLIGAGLDLAGGGAIAQAGADVAKAKFDKDVKLAELAAAQKWQHTILAGLYFVGLIGCVYFSIQLANDFPETMKSENLKTDVFTRRVYLILFFLNLSFIIGSGYVAAVWAWTYADLVKLVVSVT